MWCIVRLLSEHICDFFFGLPHALMKSEIMNSRIADVVIPPAVGAQFNSDLIPEWKHITHMDGSAPTGGIR